MKCPAGCFHGHAGYAPNGRILACRKCAGTGTIKPRRPQRSSPATIARWMAAHERAIARYSRAFAALAATPYRALIP